MIDPAKVARSLETSEAVTGANPMNHAPAQAGGRRATERDVLLCYRVLHGREPENRQAVEVKMSGTVRDLVAGGLASDEFTSNPVVAMARGEPPLHARTSRGPGPTDLEWAAENLPLEPATRARLTTVRSWREFFAILFNDQAFRRSVPALQADPALAAALSEATGRPGGTGENAIVGAIELCLGADVKGWAAYPSALDEPVTLEILADGEPVGIALMRSVSRGPDANSRAGRKFRFSVHTSAFVAPPPTEGLQRHRRRLAVPASR